MADKRQTLSDASDPVAAPSPGSSEKRAGQSPDHNRDRGRRRGWRRRRWRRVVRFAAWSLALLAALAALALLLFPRLVSSRWFARTVSTQAARAFGRPVRIGSVGFQWSGHFELHDLRVASDAEASAPPLLEIALLRAAWAWRPLASSRIAVDECVMEGVRVRLQRRADGSLNLPRLAGAEAPPPAPVSPGIAPPSPPFPTALPIDRLHVVLRDWRVEYEDHALHLPDSPPGPFRAAFSLDALAVDLDSPRAPLTLDLRAALTAGATSATAPLALRLKLTPGPEGHLDRRAARLAAEVHFAESGGDLTFEPAAGGIPGLALRASGTLVPGAVERFAAAALGIAPPACAAGRIGGTLALDWIDNAAPRIDLRIQSEKLTVSPPAMAGEIIPCDVLVAVAATGPPTRLGEAPAPAGWIARPVVRLVVPALVLTASARAETTADPAAPRIDGDIAFRHRPAELRPFLKPFAIALPPDLDRLRQVDYSARIGGDPATSITLSGRLAADTTPPSWRELLALDGPTSARLALAVDHRVSYSPSGDRLDAHVALADCADGVFPAIPWIAADVRLRGVRMPDRSGRMAVEWHPAAMLGALVAAGVAPDAAHTSGSLFLTADFDHTASNTLRVVTALRGGFGGTLRAVEGLIPAQLAGALGPVALHTDGATLSLDADMIRKKYDARLLGEAEVRGAWRGAPDGVSTLSVAVVLPARWDVRAAVGGDGALVADADLSLAPRIFVTDNETVPLIEPVECALGLKTSVALSTAGALLPVHADLRFDAGAIRAPGLAALGGLGVGATLDYDPAPPGRAAWDATLDLADIAAMGPLPMRLGPLRATTRGSAAIAEPNLRIDRLELRLDDSRASGPLAEVEAACRLTSPTGPFALRGRIDLPALARIGDWLEAVAEAPAGQDSPRAAGLLAPETARRLREALSQLPVVEGRVGIVFEGEGALPTAADIAARRLPLHGRFEVHAADLATTLPRTVAVSKLGTDLALSASESLLELSVRGGLGNIIVLTTPLLATGPAEWRADARIDAAAGEAAWTDWTFRLPDWGLTMRLDGSASGWNRPFPVSSPDDAAALRAMGLGRLVPFASHADVFRAVALGNRARIEWDHADWLALGGSGVRVRGGARLAAQIVQEPGRVLRTELSAEFSGVSAEMGPALRLGGVNGALRLSIAGQRAPIAPELSGYASRLAIPFGDGYETGPAGDSVRRLPPPRPEQVSSLQIAEIAAPPWVLRGIDLTSEGDLRDWMLAFACQDLMGGRARGRFRLMETGGDLNSGDWTVAVESSFTGVSARSALAAWRDLPAGETELNGVLDLRWHVDRQASAPLDMLRDIELRLTVTRIGRRALQGFLLALDPEERNPSFVSARQALRYGRPDAVHFVFRHGLMDMGVRLVTVARTWDMTLLDRAPVGEVTRLESLQSRLDILRQMRFALDLLSGLDHWLAGSEIAARAPVPESSLAAGAAGAAAASVTP